MTVSKLVKYTIAEHASTTVIIDYVPAVKPECSPHLCVQFNQGI